MAIEWQYRVYKVDYRGAATPKNENASAKQNEYNYLKAHTIPNNLCVLTSELQRNILILGLMLHLFVP